MSGKYGYSLVDWKKAKEEMRQILIGRAKVRRNISYSELVAQIQSISLDPNCYALTAMLNEIALEEDTAGRGMLTVIVIHKDGDMQPGPGFFELAKKQGRDTSNILRLWVEESRRVYAYWSGRRR